MPPAQSNNKPTENPYDFIVNGAPKPQKPGLLSNQGSFKQRLLVILGGGLILIILIVIISSIFASKPKTAGLLSIAQQQSALITLSGLGERTAAQQITRDLAVNVELNLESAQVSLVSYLEDTGMKLTATSLLSSQTTPLSTELTATPANNFDSEYVQLTQTQLKNYVSALKQVFSSSDPSSQKIILRNLYAGANLLLGQANSTAANL